MPSAGPAENPASPTRRWASATLLERDPLLRVGRSIPALGGVGVWATTTTGALAALVKGACRRGAAGVCNSRSARACLRRCSIEVLRVDRRERMGAESESMAKPWASRKKKARLQNAASRVYKLANIANGIHRRFVHDVEGVAHRLLHLLHVLRKHFDFFHHEGARIRSVECGCGRTASVLC